MTGLEDPNICRGMILIGPLIMGNSETATPAKRFMARMLAKIVPNMGLVAINNDDLSKDKEVVICVENSRRLCNLPMFFLYR